MNIEMHGKKIAAIYWPAIPDAQHHSMRAGPVVGDLFLSATYHGDRDEFWVVQMKDGKEFARHNLRHLESIEWAPNESGTEHG